MLDNLTSFVEPGPCRLTPRACAVLPTICATTSATRVISVIGVSNKPVDHFACCPIAVVFSVTHPQLLRQIPVGKHELLEVQRDADVDHGVDIDRFNAT